LNILQNYFHPDPELIMKIIFSSNQSWFLYPRRSFIYPQIVIKIITQKSYLGQIAVIESTFHQQAGLNRLLLLLPQQLRGVYQSPYWFNLLLLLLLDNKLLPWPKFIKESMQTQNQFYYYALRRCFVLTSQWKA
jgi:hypothetical protein